MKARVIKQDIDRIKESVNMRQREREQERDRIKERENVRERQSERKERDDNYDDAFDYFNEVRLIWSILHH